MVKQFTFDEDIDEPQRYDPDTWTFFHNMCKECPEVFGECENNYDVSEILAKHGVVGTDDSEDSECDNFCVYFNSEENAKKFIERLNSYISS